MVTAASDAVGTRVMFENERVRVWDQVIEPGATLEKHAHRLTYFYIIPSGALIRFADPDNPAIYKDVQFHDDQIGFHTIPAGTEKIDNRLHNTCDKTHRAFVVELKGGPALGTATPGRDKTIEALLAQPVATPPSEAVGTELMFENDLVRIWNLSLAPGEQLAKHIHTTEYFFIVEHGGLIRFENPDDATDFHDVQFQDDQVTYRAIAPGEGKIDNRLTNIGTKHHRNYVIELLA